MRWKTLLHLGLTLAVLGAVAVRPLLTPNRFWQDQIAKLPATGTLTGKVVVVGISDADIARYGTWPWDRSQTAKLFAAVAACKPKVMAFDGYFPHRAIAQPGDTVFERTLATISSQTKVILPFQFEGVRNDPNLDKGVSPTPVLLRTSAYQMLTDQPALMNAPFLRSEGIFWGDSTYQTHSIPAGHIHSAADPEDGTYRRNLLVVRHGEDFFPSVVVALLAAYDDANLGEVSLSPDRVRVKNRSIPMDKYGFAPLRWVGKPGSITTIPASDLLEGKPGVAEKLNGRIVVIGVTTAAALNRETGDFFRTPVADRFPGVEIWGVALENALQGTTPISPAWLRLLEILLAVGLAGLVWMTIRRKGWGIAPQVAGGVGFLGTMALLLALDRVLSVQTALDLPLAGMLLGWAGVWAWIPAKREAQAAVGLVMPSQKPAVPDDGRQRIGKFVILRELGRGAMGVVYDGIDEELDRHAAIKVISPERKVGEKPDESLERFKREARAIALLSSPYIVSIYETGEWEGSHYIAMEFLDGKGLDAILLERRLSWSEVQSLGQQMLTGLAEAHAKGVVHRDIKPANIMVVDGGTRAKITDFGLARQGDASMSLTQEGSVLGTPYYMAPEQVEGKRTDALSDQFSMGLLLFEMLAGERAYEGEDVRGIMLKILLHPPKDLAPFLGFDVPTQVLDFMDRILQKDPTQRFADLNEAAAAWSRLPS